MARFRTRAVEEAGMSAMTTRFRFSPAIPLIILTILSGTVWGWMSVTAGQSPLSGQNGENVKEDAKEEDQRTVARVSLVAGQVGHRHSADGADEWFDATINLAVGEGDEICTGEDGRTEIQTDLGITVRLASSSYCQFSRLTPPDIRLSLTSGTATLRLKPVGRGGSVVTDDANPSGTEPEISNFEVSTPTVSITSRSGGTFRVTVNDDGRTELVVREGQVEVYRQEIGHLVVAAGRMFTIDGADVSLFSVRSARPPDEWDRWNERRNGEIENAVPPPDGQAVAVVPAGLAGYSELNRYGEWLETREYGRVWSPSGISTSWAPYRLGYWRWYSAYGWTWISHEPWGWLPYHYGRWTWHRNRWCWVPVGRPVVAGRPGPLWRWSPHLVAFFGWGDIRYNNGYRTGFSDGYWTGFRDGRGWIGWSPLAPGEGRGNYRSSAGQSLVNYGLPGGASLLDSRRFMESRVVRIDGGLTAPARTRSGGLPEAARPVREQDLRPTRALNSSRLPLLEQPEVNRRISSSRTLITRGVTLAPEQARSPRTDSVNGNGAGSSIRSIRDGYVVRPSRPTEPVLRPPAGNSPVLVRPQRPAVMPARRPGSEIDQSQPTRPLRSVSPSGSVIEGRPPVVTPRSGAASREVRMPETRVYRREPAPPASSGAATGGASAGRPPATVGPARPSRPERAPDQPRGTRP